MADPCIRYRAPGHVAQPPFQLLDLTPQCVAPGLHLPGCGDCECACHGVKRPEHDDPVCDSRHEAVGCTGCAPAPAEQGLLCWRDWRTTADLLGAREQQIGPHGITWIYSWLSENVQPSQQAGGGRGGEIDAPTAARVGIIDLRTEILQRLAEHCEHAAEQLGRGGPNRPSVQARASWLLANLDSVVNLSMIEGLYSDLTDWAIRAHLLAPWRGKPRLLPARACPICHAIGTMWVPAADVDIHCRSCRVVIDSRRWEQWERYLIAQAKHEPAPIPEPRRGLRADESADVPTPGGRA